MGLKKSAKSSRRKEAFIEGGPVGNEEEYRALDRLSYSAIKDFESNGPSWFYKVYIEKSIPRPDVKGGVIGSVADCLLLDKDNYHNRYFQTEIEEYPTAKRGIFCDKLYEITLANIEDGKLSPNFNFMEAAQWAYNKSTLKSPKFDKLMEDFEGSDIEKVYQEKLASVGKRVITMGDYEKALKIKETLLNHPNTSWLWDMKLKTQLPLVFSYRGVEMKSLMDILWIDKKQKLLYPIDMKCTYDVQQFPYTFVKMKYYIQEALYTIGLEAYRDEHYPGFEIKKFKFLVADENSNEDPCFFDMTLPEGDFWNGGITSSGRRIKGLDQSIDDIKWHKDNGIWTCGKQAYENKGQVKITL